MSQIGPYPVNAAYRAKLVRERGADSNVVQMYDESHPPLGAANHQGFVTAAPTTEFRLPDAETIEKKGKNAEHGRLTQNNQVDRNAARGIKGSATAADGRTHIRGFACPSENMYLTADRRMWCPLVDYDLKKVGKLLDTAFGTRR